MSIPAPKGHYGFGKKKWATIKQPTQAKNPMYSLIWSLAFYLLCVFIFLDMSHIPLHYKMNTHQIHEFESLQKFAVSILQSVCFINNNTTPFNCIEFGTAPKNHFESGDNGLELVSIPNDAALGEYKWKQNRVCNLIANFPFFIASASEWVAGWPGKLFKLGCPLMKNCIKIYMPKPLFFAAHIWIITWYTRERNQTFKRKLV